jgi:exopolysaccharide biosynthesis protein
VYSPTLTDQAISFFGLDFDGKPVIRDTVTYRQMSSDLRDVTGSGVIVLSNGEVPGDFSGYSTNRHPRNVVGYTEDGNTLFFMIVDGRQALWSDGMLYWEMGEIMKSLGCSWASNLDGGGSAQLVIRHPSANIYQLRNRASDGAQRPVVNTWMVTVNEP